MFQQKVTEVVEDLGFNFLRRGDGRGFRHKKVDGVVGTAQNQRGVEPRRRRSGVLKRSHS